MTKVDTLKKLASALIGGTLTPDRVPGKTVSDVIDYIARYELGESLGKLTVASAQGATVNTTKITVTPEKESGNTYAYKISPGSITAPEYLEEAVNLIDWDGKSDIAGEDGHYIGIYEIDSDRRIVKFGQISITVNLG